MTDFADLVVRARDQGIDQTDTKLKGLEQTTGETESSMGRLEKQSAGLSGEITSLGKKVAIAGASMAAVGAVFGAAFATSVREAEQFETTMFRVEAVINATGGTAGRTADQLRDQARSLARDTLESTEGILKAQQTLLTFRNVQGDVFDRAIIAAADMTAALGGDLNGATMQLAKALENPVQGLSALTRSGTVFTEAQKEMVRAMVEAGDTAGAQAFILSELEAQYGGTATAAAQGLAGAQDSLAQSLQELKLAFSDQFDLLGIATNANLSLAGAIDRVTNSLPQIVNGIKGLGVVLTALAFTQVPAAFTAIATLTGGMSVAAIAAGVFTAAVNLARAAVIALGGPLGVVWGLIGASAAAWLVFKDNMDPATTETYAAQGAVNSLNGALANFYGSAAPEAGKSAIDLANDYVKLAEAAYDAAEAEVARQRATMQATAAAANAATDPYGALITGPEAAEAAVAYRKSLEELERVEAQLADARARRNQTARAITGSMSDEMTRQAEVAAGLTVTIEGLDDAVTSAGGSTSAMTDEVEDAAKALEEANRKAEELRKEFQRPMVTAINGVADAFGDFVARGFRDFGSFKDAVISGFRNMLAQMVAMAARTRFMNFIGMGSGAGGGLLSGALGSAGGGGMLAGVGGLAGLGSAFMGGASFFASGVASGGIAGGLSALGTAASGATLGLGGAAAALGAFALPVAGVIAAISFFSTKTKELDNGLRITANGADTLVQSFRNIQKTRYWGLSKRRSTSVTGVSAATSDPISQAVADIQGGIMDAAGVLGFGADVFDGFYKRINVSLKGLNDQQRQAAIQKALIDIGDSFAGMIPGLKALRMSGEGATAALERLVNNLTNVNAWWDRLGFTLYDLSLAGADAAGSIVELFGGLDALSASATRYYTQFYSDQERTAQAIREMGQTLQTLGIDTLPATRAQFRALVDAAEAAGDNALVANLIQISGAFAEITAASDDLARSLDASQFATRAAFDFARAQVQQGAGAIDFEETDTQLLREIVTAIREGNIAIARNTADTYREVLRQNLTPEDQVA